MAYQILFQIRFKWGERGMEMNTYILAKRIFNDVFVICLQSNQCFGEADFLLNQQFVKSG